MTAPCDTKRSIREPLGALLALGLLSGGTPYIKPAKGKFSETAPNAPEAKDVDYFYVQSMLRF